MEEHRVSTRRGADVVRDNLGQTVWQEHSDGSYYSEEFNRLVIHQGSEAGHEVFGHSAVSGQGPRAKVAAT